MRLAWVAEERDFDVMLVKRGKMRTLILLCMALGCAENTEYDPGSSHPLALTAMAPEGEFSHWTYHLRCSIHLKRQPFIDDSVSMFLSCPADSHDIHMLYTERSWITGTGFGYSSLFFSMGILEEFYRSASDIPPSMLELLHLHLDAVKDDWLASDTGPKKSVVRSRLP